MIDNTVTLSGNVTRDPEMRYTPNGTAQVVLGIAQNRRWKDSNGADQEHVSYFDVVCWQQLAENVCDTVTKGDRVTVTGRLEQRSWETPEGDKRSKVEIVADDVAASFKWATATITRNPKKGARDDGPPRPEPGGSRTPATATADGRQYDDDEPF